MAKKKNGNSNGDHRFQVSASKYDEEGRLVLDDLVPVSVLLMFFVQKLGKASFEQIAEKVRAASVVINEHLLMQGIEALQARQFVSYGKGKNTLGEVVDQWKPRKANFAGVPDVAQVDQAFLSNLVTTPDAEELIASLNDAEEEGDGTAKATEKLKYSDYYACEVTFQTCQKDGKLLGGNPSSPAFDALVKKGPKVPAECDLRFPRNSEGQPIIPISNIRGWLRALFRKYVSEAAVQYISIRGGLIEFEGQITQYARQVVDLSGGARGGGRGITTYECIETNEKPARIKFDFVVPKRGVATFDQFVAWLVVLAPQSPRGLSNARSNEFGFVEVVDAKYKGELNDAGTAIQAVSDRLGVDARVFAEKVLAGIGDRKLDLRPGRDKRVE